MQKYPAILILPSGEFAEHHRKLIWFSRNIDTNSFHIQLQHAILICQIILGLIVLAAALVTWCFVRFNAKKRFSKDSKGKSNKYSKGPVDLQVRKQRIISTAAAVLKV